MIEIVFFDAGETILHAHPSFPELFARTCAAHGHEVSTEQVRRITGEFLGHLIEGTARESGIRTPSLSAEQSFEFWTFMYRKLLRELGLEEALAPELYKVFSDSRSYKLFDDVVPTLRQLEDEGYKLGLISNFEGWLEKMLVELEVGHAFDVTVISGLEGVEKPEPRIYEIALERAGVKPESAMHVGDSPNMDVKPALSLGMQAVLVDRVDRHPNAVDCPRISSLAELIPVVRGS